MYELVVGRLERSFTAEMTLQWSSFCRVRNQLILVIRINTEPLVYKFYLYVLHTCTHAEFCLGAESKAVDKGRHVFCSKTPPLQ